MIKAITIQNYKSLENVSLTLEPVTVFIGRSGTGKSNFINALKFLRRIVTARTTDLFNEAEPFGAGGITISFDILFNVPAIEGDYRYILRMNRLSPTHPATVARETLSLCDKVLFDRQQGTWTVSPKADVIQNVPIMVGAIPGVQEIAIAFRYLSTGIVCYDFPSTVLLAQSSNNSGTAGFGESGENFIETFKAITNNLHMLEKWKQVNRAIRALNANIVDISLNFPKENALVVKQLDHGLPRTLNLGVESEGLRRFIAHLLALYQEPSKLVLAFEQPETGIHPGALQSLAEEFKACPTNHRGQVLLTTHSPQLLDLFKPEQIRVVEMEKYVTKIGPMAPDQLSSVRENMLRPGELLTVDLARVAPTQ